MSRAAMRVALALLAGCAGGAARDPAPPAPAMPAPIAASQPTPAAAPNGARDATSDAAPGSAPAPAAAGETWLRGTTHVHARPSGDSATSIADVIRWYETRGYDFIALTDHNRVSELDPSISTRGQPAIRATGQGLIVLAGIELTHNPSGCLPRGDASDKCRIHVNLLGTTGRTDGKLAWANLRSRERLDKYQAALDQQRALGGIAQINHPQWFWGMTPELLAELARRGFRLVEIANAQFAPWNAGDADHLSTEALWDAALARGETLWGVASDDAHHYDGGGKYPAGGAWVMVRARRAPEAILEALAAGRFYASTGVVLERAEVESGELVVSVGPGETAAHAIEFIENGRVVATVRGNTARHTLPKVGYVRAVVTRGDGKRAWVQPARRP